MNNKIAPPEWQEEFHTLIQESWENHGLCRTIMLLWDYEESKSIWHILATPPFQEVLGGKEDGEKVWTGFEFRLNNFIKSLSKIENSSLDEFAVASVCAECNKIPKIVFIGKYKGNLFHLDIWLEPHENSPVSETIDAINNKLIIREDYEYNGVVRKFRPKHST